MASRRIGVAIVNTGTPSEPTPQAVRAYLKRFLGNPRIRPMNKVAWSIILNLFILPKRGVKSAEKYRSIWTPNGSPFAIELQKLEDALNHHFAKRPEDVLIRYAMSFDRPFLSEVMDELLKNECSQIIVLPLYPQSAFSTTGVVDDDLERVRRLWKRDVEVKLIDNYHDNTMYIQAIASSIRQAGFDVSQNSNDHLMMSYHSIPLNDIDDGDTYGSQTLETSKLIAQTLGIKDCRWSIGYQCRFDKGRNWLEPYTSDTMKALAGNDKIGRLFFVCPNFSIDCLETLYDIEHEIKPQYLEALQDSGRKARPDSFTYVPCLNSSEAQVQLIAGIINSNI